MEASESIEFGGIERQLQAALQLLQRGELDAAESQYKTILKQQPDCARASFYLGVIYQNKNQLGEAIAAYQTAIQNNLNDAEVYNNLGNALRQQGQLTEAIAAYQTALQVKPHHAVAHNNLGVAFRHQRNLEAAMAAYQAAIDCDPNSAAAHNNLGNVLRQLERFPEAIAAYEAALQINPSYAAAHKNLGNALRENGQLTEAVVAYQRALQLNPTFAEAHNNLGNVFRDQGKLADAIAAYQQALQWEPDFALAHSNLMYTLNYCSDYKPAAIYQEHRRWATYQTASLPPLSPHRNNRRGDRRLRLGYVSGDFKRHSVAYFLEPLLAAHDHRQFAIIGYANNKQIDGVTQRLKQLVDDWRDIADLDDDAVATLIRQDQIDVLVDLSGHTRDNRLLVFARKPAPIQVSYLGYPNTTGLDTMDYRLTDAWADPEELTEAGYTEQLVRLPHGFLCYQPAAEAPAVNPLPALENGYITFGSFNNLTKVSPATIAQWSAILLGVPLARLVVKAKALGDEGTRDYLYDLFRQQGIAADRVELLGHTPGQQGHLAQYNRIDIALDTFPYNGTTTTCEALWMGIPVITLAGRTHVSRVGGSLLATVGLPELIAESAAAYQHIAIALAHDRERLQHLRQTLRDRLQISPLMDATLITRSIEAAYRKMWQSWCNDQQASLTRQLQSAGQWLQSGDLERAKLQYQAVLEQDPHHAYANFCVGYIYQQQKSIADAIAYYQKAVQSKPDYLEALNNLGNLQWKQGDLNAAIQCYQKTLELQPDAASGYYNLGLIYADQGRFKEALEAYQKAIELGGDRADLHCKMGLVFLQQDKVQEARQNYQSAIQVQPVSAAAHFGLGFVYNKQAQISAAIAAYRQAIAINPDYAAAHNNLGNAFRSQGKLTDAIAAYRQAIQLEPQYVDAHTNLLFTLNCSSEDEPAAIYQAHRQWANCHAASLMPALPRYDNERQSDRRLRIGYVSGDLRAHSVAYFLEPLLAARDPHQFEIVCYANNLEVDDTTERLRQLVDDWQDIASLSDQQIVKLIRQDAIDILVDLSGHTNGNRLRVFARKPAPVQVSYIGYPNTTGLDTMDYRFTDVWADPEGQTEALHTEKLVRLPHGFLCYRPVADCPAVGPLPCTETGYITFGSFNDLSKVGPQVVAQWSAIVAAVPNARLVVKAKSLADEGTRNYLYGLFQQHGIAADRVELRGQTVSQAEHLALYNRVDIALDTFPYNGTTTTCEALWMGVPVITLAGPTHVSRVGVSLLTRVGLPELIAESAEAYLQSAIALAHDPTRLRTLRESLRDRLQVSPLMNADLMARSVEAAYRTIWQSWCCDADSAIERHLQAGYEFFGQSDLERAGQQYRAVLQHNPEHAYANFCLGCVYQNQGNFAGAIAAYEKALQSKPDYAEALNNLGNVYREQGSLNQAIPAFHTAIQLQPNRPDSYVNLGTALRLQGQFSEAIAAYQKALKLNPNVAEAHNNLGNALKEQGKFSEAITAYRQALQLNPSYVVAHSNLVFALNYSSDYAPSAIYREHQHWAASQAAALTRAMQPHDCDRDPDRRLRIGYVSGDFKSHSVAYFLEPLLAAHDHRQFEIIGYANNQKVDDTTRRLQQLADGWRHIAALSDEQAAALIRQDKVDVLVDLSGHTKGNRLRVFAQKPAPLQVTYLGYPNTTGLGTMDYRLTDAWADPEGADALHTEELVRLPHGFLCYQPWPASPDVSPSPALTAGHVTFGSFNNLAKVSPQVVAEWSAILAAVPGSRLIIKAKSLGDTGTQDYLYDLFQQHEMARDRIELLGRIPSQAEHLALYSRVDIALDTFPYNGTTTTCESLWMGVPVITLAGQTHASRVGVSLLTAVGLSDLITASVADYRQRAIDLAGDLDHLQQLRVTMRDRMQAAPLTNASVITQSIEMAYRTMWHRFCDRAAREPDFNQEGMNMPSHEPTAQGQTMDNQCLEVAQHPNQLESPKFILIRAWGHGFWSDVDHVLGQLFLAAITGRIPVVYWGANSRYRNADENAFENYFEPVSNYTIDHLIGQSYTFYPDHWTEETLKDNPAVGDDNLQTNLGARSLPDVAALSRNEDVVVSSSHGYLADLMAQIESDHPFVGQSPQAVYRYLVKKYIKLKPEINREIEQFWAANLADHPTVAVHIRGSDKIAEVPELTQINQRYHQVIRNCLRRVPDALIFLLTDEISVVEEYQRIYGNKVRFTSAFRTREQVGIHFQSHASPKQRGVEVIKDTYLAAKCDYFVGNGWSNVTATILHLKDWQKDQHTLVKANVLFRRQANQPSAAPKSSNSDNTSTQISAQKNQVHSGHQPPKMNSNAPGQTTKVPANLGNTTQHGGQSSANARRLHIGGKVRVPGWEVLNAVPGPYVDHMGNANDLSRFENETFTDIYASHLVEHLDYRDELVNTLKEWYRVLAPGGRVYISVPDMDILAKLFISREKLNFSERFMVMRMMFGGHVDQYDYHVVGLNQDFLTMYLKQAGYVNVRRVDRFGLFNDTSNYVFKDVLISLNLIAEKPKQAAASPNQVTMTINQLIKLANDLGAQGQVEKAIDYFRQVLAVDPNSFAATVNLGNMLKAQGKYSEALASYRKALTIIPNHPAVENNIGGILKDQGLITEAVDCFYQASTDPSFRMARSNLLLTLNYSDAHEPSVLYNEHRTWADLCATPLAEQIKPFENEPDPERRVRIGYVSGSFHTHSIAYFFEPLLTAANHSNFEVICYASNARNDVVTQRLQALADDWRDIRFLPDEQVADQIRQDKIDILVDLSGHTNGSRLLVFAYKPAPVQVTYIGYPNTTGLDTMDYRLTDAWADPEGQTEAWHTEQLIRLPHGFLCYRPPVDCPEVGPLPTATTGHITFGSFNTLAKVSPQLIGHWSAVLLAVPQSRILIKALPLSDAGIQDSVKRLFEQNGVTGDRVELLGRIPAVNDHLALYNRVDIALDTFPYNGTTTTCEAMWMGVPVVTWAGQTHASRVGVSLLASVGLEDLIADSAETYVQTAIALAGDQERLLHLRESMRDRLQQAPLTNAELITQSVEEAYRNMWRQWCSTR